MYIDAQDKLSQQEDKLNKDKQAMMAKEERL